MFALLLVIAPFLIVVGLLTCIGAFCFAIANMYRGAINKGPSTSFGVLFKRHLGAMIVMVLGIVLALSGLIIVVANASSKVFH